MSKKIKTVIIFLTTSLSLVYTLSNPIQTAYHAKKAVEICISSLVPSLFIFMVLSRMLSHLCSSCPSDMKFIRCLSQILNLPPTLIPMCITGLFCGAPSGAFGISRIYGEGSCSKDEAERACILANNCSAAFILSFISSVLGSRTAGLYILISNILATVFIYMVFFRKGKHKYTVQYTKSKEEDFGNMVTESISSSITATVTMCGFVIFFYTLSSILCDNISGIIGKESLSFFNAVISSLLEISTGILHIGNLDGTGSVVTAASAVAFMGISMLLQTGEIMRKHEISTGNFYISKILCAIVSPIIAVIIMLLSPEGIHVSAMTKKVPTVSVKDISYLLFASAITLIGACLLTHLDKKHKK